MLGIDLNKPIVYHHASLRFFKENEYHVARFCTDNVLLLVYDGVLRFSENGIAKEVSAGEYYIQKKNCHHEGKVASDAPKYLYVHFDAELTDSNDALSLSGRFDTELFSELMKRIDTLAHQNHLHAEMEYLFLKLLLSLKDKASDSIETKKLTEYIEKNIKNISSLSDLCEEFHYSKNYIIRIFNKAFGVSPIRYVNDMKIKRAMYLLESTSLPIGEIAADCGFSDYPYFYKRFMSKTGKSPLKWREETHLNPSGQRG